MTNKNFYIIYIPALEEAFRNDNVNHGFSVFTPDFYIEKKYLTEINDYLENQNNDFLDKVAYYFDAKSHNFPSISGVSIEEYKENLIKNMQLIKKYYDLV
jgi:hypothetical protein